MSKEFGKINDILLVLLHHEQNEMWFSALQNGMYCQRSRSWQGLPKCFSLIEFC